MKPGKYKIRALYNTEDLTYLEKKREYIVLITVKNDGSIQAYVTGKVFNGNILFADHDIWFRNEKEFNRVFSNIVYL